MHKNNGRQCTNLAPDTPPPEPPEKPYMFINNKDYSLIYYDDWNPLKNKQMFMDTRLAKMQIEYKI